MNTKRMIAVAAAMAGVSGCATYGNAEGAYDPEAFGEANRQTYAAMIANPEPVYTEDATSSGQKAADAIERYRTDTVKQPDPVSSTESPDGG